MLLAKYLYDGTMVSDYPTSIYPENEINVAVAESC